MKYKFSDLKQNFQKKIFSLLCLTGIVLLPFCNYKNDEQSFGINKIESYRATWWHLPYSTGKSGDWGRPDYGVINISNGEYTIRHAIMEGRPLGDYRLPYWPIRSFVSIFDDPAELTHQSSVSLKLDNNQKVYPFRCGNQKFSHSSLNNNRIEQGFELSEIKNSDVLKVTNQGSESPILMEHLFIIERGSCDIPVFIKAINTTEKPINDVVVTVSYSQDFNWDIFGASSSKDYSDINAPVSGKAEAFFAFSSGMQKGFEFNINESCELTYQLDQEFNAWNVSVNNISVTLEPGDSLIFSYNLRIIDTPPDKITPARFISTKRLDVLKFTNLIPMEVKTAPVNTETRVTIEDVIRNIDKPKVRGLHRITGLPKALDDLALLKEWGGNLAVTQGNPEDVRQIIERGHKLGIEMFIPGTGSYNTGGPPSFDQLFSANLRPSELPDAYGQDEDHYYWYPVKATLNFEAEFGKPMSKATQEEKVTYWSRCFVNKWRKTLENIREHHPEGKIWFYMPAPSVANIDPFDYHELFFNEVSKLGDALTVLPFYYGIDYDQIEYMVRRWKNSGISRVVFLPGGPTYLKPNQFFRAITAARRGGADGACGFAFSVTESDFDDEWRWKSVMLASQANFPSPELDAYCFIEEPAELVEALAASDVFIYSPEIISDDFAEKLDELIPGKVDVLTELPKDTATKSGRLYVITGNESEYPGKGIMRMSGNLVRLNGPDETCLSNAKSLFLRFAELASAEKNN